jgi:hypothetical protein
VFFAHRNADGRKTGRADADAQPDAQHLLPVLLTLAGEVRAAFLAALQREVRAQLLELVARQRAGPGQG